MNTPALVVFELERKPRVVGADDLTAAELVRVVDWVVSHGLDGLDLHAWLDRHLANRGLRVPMPPASEDRPQWGQS